MSVCYYFLNLRRDYKGENDTVFSVMLYTVSRKRHCFALLYLRHSSTNFNIFCGQQGRIIKYSVQTLFIA